MAKGRGGISGLAVLIGLAGATLLWSGIKNASIADTLRAGIRAQPIPSGPSIIGRARAERVEDRATPTARGTATGAAVVATARAHLGVPYRWAGETPSGWDCSGMVTWVLTQHGVKLPSNVHTTAAVFYVWTGAQTIPRASAAPGDLVCWSSHIGIATSRTTMIHAPGLGKRTQESGIWSIPAPTIRRPKAYGGVSP